MTVRPDAKVREKTDAGPGLWDLGTLPGGTYSGAMAINIFDHVVGGADFPNSQGGQHDFLWTCKTGKMDLNQHIPSHPAYELFQAVAINVGGQILANGTFQGQNRAFLLTP